jgi:SAM-dependent methyltransferase
LEYGCNVGALTKRLAPKVGAKGKIFATDISLKKVEMVAKRVKRFPWVSVHHHPHLDNFKLDLPKVDGVVSVGTLSYMQNPKQLLVNLGKHVKKGGEIIFVDFDKFFYVIPNVKWIESDPKLVALFAKAGFKVHVERRKGLLWQHIVITGVKV